jgi:threonine synthase
MTDTECRLRTTRADCVACGREHRLSARSGHCDCERRENLSVRYPLDPATRSELLRTVGENQPSLWRYAPILPVDARFGSRLKVGWTPLLDCGDVGGTHLYIKDETRNPSGSLKDRASEVVVAVAVAHGIADVIVASTGNAAASLACIAASAGIRATILVPESAPPAKLAQIMAYGASVYRVAGSYDDACSLALKVSENFELFNRSTGINPFTREGKKTCALEIAEQLGWQAPDWVLVPTGDGNILSAVWKGFQELAALGLLTSLPRLAAVQSAASCAIVKAYGPHPARHRPDRTIADSITVDEPRDRTAALAALSASDGLAVEVDDHAIVDAVQALASRFGVFVEPSSAAAFAAFEFLNQAGQFKRGHRVVCLATGTGLKDLRGVLTPGRVDALPLVDPDDWQSIAPA